MPGSSSAEERQLFAIDGLFCGGCARGLEAKLARLDGVVEAGVHFVTASALVRWTPGRCDRDAIARCVADAGYRLIERHDLGEVEARFAAETRSLSIRLVVAIVFGMWSMAAALVLYAGGGIAPATRWWVALLSGVLALPVLFYSGSNILRMAWRSIRLKSPSIDLLLAIGVMGSVLMSLAALAGGSADVYFDTATMLVTLLVLGRLIETRVRGGAIRALRALEAVAPELARRADTGAVVAARTLGPGDEVLIDAGAAVTVDGVVVQGVSALDRAVLTGESAAFAVSPGERVQAGAVNLVQRLRVRVDRAPGDRDIDRMGGRIAIEVAARGERRVPGDTLIRWLLVGAPAFAIIAFGIGLWRGGGATGLAHALAVTVVICPCALVVAAPIAQIRAAIAAARRGLRIADPIAFESLATLRSAVFDKTGTLTLGTPRVVAVDPAPGVAADAMLALAARAETGIDHPLARAIVAAHGGETGPGGLRHPRGAEVRDVDGSLIAVGGMIARDADGRTRLQVLRDGTVMGTIALADGLDPGAAQLIVLLRDRGVAIRLATGDAMSPARSVAAHVGIADEEVHADCTPIAKVELVRALPGPVMVVGDGINDAPALAAADCGVSVARAHAAATATAGVAVIDGGIDRIATGIAIARDLRGIIRQNLGVAIAYNLVAIPMAMIGAMSPVIAAIAMVSSSALVSLNALRLR